MAIETKVCFHRYGIPSGENGSAIAPGKVADLVAAGQIKDIKPVMTVVGGKIAYRWRKYGSHEIGFNGFIRFMRFSGSSSVGSRGFRTLMNLLNRTS